jgi:1-deoxy-D-xylulose-5-phosphate synthase
VYATFLNRAFDQLLMDVALHELPVTVVLDRAGLTGDDGPSHNGMWDLALLGMVPGLRVAAPRDEPTLRAQFRAAVAHSSGPTVLRFPKSPLSDDLTAIRRVPGAADETPVDVLVEPDQGRVDVLIVSIGAVAGDVIEAAAAVRRAGYTVRVVDPSWITPVSSALTELARDAALVVTVEDGVSVGGAGSRIGQAARAAGVDVPTREIGVPTEFLAHGKLSDVRAVVGLTAQDIGRRIVEWAALVDRGSEPDSPAGERADVATRRTDNSDD